MTVAAVSGSGPVRSRARLTAARSAANATIPAAPIPATAAHDTPSSNSSQTPSSVATAHTPVIRHTVASGLPGARLASLTSIVLFVRRAANSLSTAIGSGQAHTRVTRPHTAYAFFLHPDG